MPTLNAKTFAELLQLPAYAQLRVLQEHKYPKKTPGMFKAPYYQAAINGIKRFYKGGNDETALAAARERADEIKLDVRRRHNHRVIDAFEDSDEVERSLKLRPDPEFSVDVGGVQLRLAPSLLVHEGDQPKVVYYNLRAAPIDPDVARMTAEIGHFILEQNDARLPLRHIEVVDFKGAAKMTWKRRRKKTIEKMEANGPLLALLWESI